MAFQVDPIQVTGLKELGDTLRLLDAKVQKKVARKGLRAGAKVVRDEIRATAPKRSGDMARAFVVTGGGRPRNGVVTVRVQIGKKWFVGDQFYAGFIEFGWRVGSRKLGDRRKQVPGRHFVEQAARAKAAAAVEAVVSTVRAEMERAIEESKRGA